MTLGRSGRGTGRFSAEVLGLTVLVGAKGNIGKLLEAVEPRVVADGFRFKVLLLEILILVVPVFTVAPVSLVRAGVIVIGGRIAGRTRPNGRLTRAKLRLIWLTGQGSAEVKA